MEGGPEEPGGLISIFIVDDEDMLREIYQDYLPSKGFRIIGTAMDGDDAIRQLAVMHELPDVVLMDHRMPKKSGLEAAKVILQREPRHRILFVTADLGVGKQAESAGAAGVLIKPFGMEDLAVALRAVADKSR